MKVIIVGPAYPYRGGLATFNERLATEYQRQGHVVKIYTFTLQYPSFFFPGKSQYSSDIQKSQLNITRQINSVNPFNWVKVGKMIKNEKADLVIFVYWMSFMALCFGTIAKFSSQIRSKKIGLVHNMLPHESSFLDRILPKYFVKQMDGFIALSNSVIDDIDKFDKKIKSKVVSPHPIYDHYGEKMNRKEAIEYLKLNVNIRYMLFFGFIRNYKGLDLLLNALADERLCNLDIELIVAGEFYESEDKYIELESKLKLKHKIHWFKNFISDNDVKYFFSAADIVIQPYKTASQSGVTQIAYHFEKPMLVTNVGGLSEIVPDGKVGYAVNPNANEIANKLFDFFQNERYDDFFQGIINEKNKYEWKLLIQNIDKLLNDIKIINA